MIHRDKINEIINNKSYEDNYENKDVIPSKQLMEFHCGFRRLVCKPIFSQETNPGAATEKYKYMRFLHLN